MQVENGGEVATELDGFELFKILDRTDRKRLARTSASDIVRENQSARNWRGFPASAVAIGENGEGDLLVFLREEGSEALGQGVFVWAHETAELARVADDFSELPPL